MNHLKFVKNTPLLVVFSTLSSVFPLVMKHCVSCLIYYIISQPVFQGFSPTLLWKLGCVHTVPDSSCAGTKTIPDGASVHT